jgi:PAS domain S-box-containing protein
MLKNLKLRSKILLILIFISLLTTAVVGTIAFNLGISTIKKESYRNLTAIREMKAHQIENYFNLILDQVRSFSESRTIIESTMGFSEGFNNIAAETNYTASQLSEIDLALYNYYEDSFLNRLYFDEDADSRWKASDYLPQLTNQQILQYQYIVSNPFPVGEKGELSGSEANTSYDRVHQKFHPIIKKFRDRFGFYDILLVDADSGNIIYSASKEVDFGTNLQQGPYMHSNLAKVFKKVMKNPDPDAVCFEDFAEYPPSYLAPASFIGSAIYDGDQRIGVLIFQLPIDNINHIMTDGYKWEDVGLGESGETYLVGPDFLMRNQSRFLVEDPEAYFAALKSTDLPSETIMKIKALNSSVGLQPIETVGTRKALSGEVGTEIFTDYRNLEVLSSFKPLNLPGIDWVIMSEIDRSEAFAPIAVLTERFTYWFAALLLVILILSFLFSRTITRPLQLLTDKASDLAAGNLEDSVLLEQKDEIGLLAHNFEKMRGSIKKLVDDLQDINQNLELKIAQRTEEVSKAKDAAEDILELSPVPLALVDPKTAEYIQVNAAMTEFHRMDSEELLKHSTLETYFDPEKDRPIILEQLQKYGKIEGLEAHSRRIGTGEEAWTIIGVHPISYMGNEYYITSLIDITERKQLSQQISEQKALLEDTLESLTHPFYVIDAKDYSILLANSAAQKLAGSDISKCYALNHKKTGPCDSRENPCPLHIIKETKKPVVLEHTHIDAKGNHRIVEVSGYPIFDKKGEVVQMIEYSIDITDRKLAEKQLKTQAAAMQSAENAIVITNAHGFVQWVNPAFSKLTGYAPDEALGKMLSILKSGKHDEAFYKDLWDTVLEGNVWQGELINRKKSSELYYEEMTVTPVFDEKDQITQFVAIKQDISERKRLEEILIREKERMEEELNVAKDIQMSMLPLNFPPFPKRNEIDIHAHLIPAREVGGDFYDFYFLDENHICFLVGDVSGKGVPAALMMAVTKTLLKSRAGNDKSTASILTHVNNEIAKENDAYIFITIFIAILNLSTGELVYSNAGHNPSYIIRPGNQPPIKMSDLHGPVVGAMEQMSYKESRITIHREDMVVAYTDGVTEAQNSNDELYSDKRFAQFLQNWEFSNARVLVNDIVESVKLYEEGTEQFDDITILALQYMQDPDSVVSDSISFTIINKIEEINTATEQFEKFCEKNGISFSVTQKINVVFDELLINIIMYGHKDELDHEIEIDVELKGNRLVVIITDDGIPFNPFSQSSPDTKLSFEERKIGGLGIHIVKNLMDEYTYKRNVNKNIITLVKNNVNA